MSKKYWYNLQIIYFYKIYSNDTSNLIFIGKDICVSNSSI